MCHRPLLANHNATHLLQFHSPEHPRPNHDTILYHEVSIRITITYSSTNGSFLSIRAQSRGRQVKQHQLHLLGVPLQGLYRDDGKENGNDRNYRDNRKENGNHYSLGYSMKSETCLGSSECCKLVRKSGASAFGSRGIRPLTLILSLQPYS